MSLAVTASLGSNTLSSAVQRDALLSHCKGYRDLGHPPPELEATGALSALCGTSAAYMQERCDLQSYSRDLVSCPDLGSCPVPLERALDSADSEWLRGGYVHLLRPPTEAADLRASSGIRRPYCDPALVHDRVECSGCLAWVEQSWYGEVASFSCSHRRNLLCCLKRRSIAHFL